MHDLQVSANAFMDDQTRACMRLWAAKFHQHIHDYVQAKKRGIGSDDADYALAWMTRDTHDAGGFIWCCNLFGLDPDRIRHKVFFGWKHIAQNMEPPERPPKKEKKNAGFKEDNGGHGLGVVGA